MQKYLSPPSIVKELVPISEETRHHVASWRSQIAAIVDGVDPRLLVIVGPCSVHNLESTLEYAAKLKQLADRLTSQIMIVMRVYLEKPRTAHGWRGFLLDPDLSDTHDIEKGIVQSRTLLRSICSLGLPVAYEFVELFSRRYLEDFISWGCIGARTCQSPLHRQLASTLQCPVGFKNPLSGESLPAVQGAAVARCKQSIIEHDDQGRLIFCSTKGNPGSHIVLRGGTTSPNYTAPFVLKAKEELVAAHLHPSIIIDCSHHNSSYNHLEQIAVARNVMKQRSQESGIKESVIKGLMLESFLLPGTQEQYKTSTLYSLAQRNASMIDPCLGWDETAALLWELSGNLPN